MDTNTKPNGGGPAFPTKREALDPRATGWSMQEGMSLRDWFAGQAMTVVKQCDARECNPGEPVVKMLARRAYELADAMIEEGAK